MISERKREKRKEKDRKKKVRRKKEHREFISQYLLSHPCHLCKETNVDVLTFHHLNPKIKRFNISRRLDYSFIQVKKEIDKCVVLCTTCHKFYHRY